MVPPSEVSSLSMKILTTPLSGLLILEPRVFGDARGFFLESYNATTMAELGIRGKFVQDNHSYSGKDVVRGLHYQLPHPQGKLVRVVAGEILDVAVDLRRSSQTFGKWFGVKLSGDNFKILWVPFGFAHGFRVLSHGAHVLYKTTDYYHPECERTLIWDDPDLGIDWQIGGLPVISTKDAKGISFRDAEKFE
jgi:dTDP-4-dehydrorhamnose 3,5-epimerase